MKKLCLSLEIACYFILKCDMCFTDKSTPPPLGGNVETNVLVPLPLFLCVCQL